MADGDEQGRIRLDLLADEYLGERKMVKRKMDIVREEKVLGML